jgi:hypothetical protein
LEEVSVNAMRHLLAAPSSGLLCLVLLIGLSPAAWAQTPGERTAAEAKATEAKAAEAKAAASKAAEAKAAEAKAADAKAAEAKAAQEKAAQEKATPNPLWLEASVRLTKALQELLAALMGGVSWAIVALVVLLLFRDKLLDLFVRFVDTIVDRGGSLEVSAFKLQLPERPGEEGNEARPLFLSPFELDDERGPDGGLLWDIPPQYEYPTSDSVGEYRKTHLGGGAVADVMKREFDALEAACNRGESFAVLKPQLVKYVVALEEARFLDASRFAVLMASSAYSLGTDINALRPAALPADAADFLIVHAGAIALAQQGDMKGALALLKDMPFTKAPLYVPAGPMWVSASYNCLIADAKAAELSLDSADMLAKIRGLIDQAKQLEEALKTLSWNDVQLKAPKAYYAREFSKDIGSILSIYAEFGPLSERKALLLEARPHLEASVQQPDPNEPPTPLDHNNLADLYRQLAVLADPLDAAGLFTLAHGEVDQALAKERDPIFHGTRALLLLAQGREGEAAKVLEPYVGETRDEGLCSKDRVESVQNQLLAAKISVKGLGDDGVRPAIGILDSARRYVARVRSELKGDAEEFEANITELLSFAHLRIKDYPKAVERFDTLIVLPGWAGATSATKLRARVGRVLALGGYARRERRQSSYPGAKTLRARAAQDVADVLGLMKATVKLDTPGRQRLVEGLWLDAVRAIQLTAEELYAGFESAAAQDMSGELAPLLTTLAGPLDARVDAEGVERRAVLRRVQSRNALLTARLLLRLQPNSTEETLGKVVEALRSARGSERALDCQADLEEGVARLTAVRLGIGDVEREYTQAIDALERASREDVPTLRGETIRVLAQAYAMRPMVRKKKKSADK